MSLDNCVPLVEEVSFNYLNAEALEEDFIILLEALFQ